METILICLGLLLFVWVCCAHMDAYSFYEMNERIESLEHELAHLREQIDNLEKTICKEYRVR